MMKPWDEVSLGSFADIYRGGSPRPIQMYLTSRPDGVNWIKIGDVAPDAKYISDTEEKIIEAGVSRSRPVKKRGGFYFIELNEFWETLYFKHRRMYS